MNRQSSREETLFFAAAGMNTPEERAALLDRECAGDAARRARNWAQHHLITPWP